MDVAQTIGTRQPTKPALLHLVLAMHAAIFAMWTGSSAALACIGPSLERTFFFEQGGLAHGIDAPTIVEVTITGRVTVPPASYRLGSARRTVVAHVERVLKGQIDGKVVKIMWLATGCDQIFRVGDKGIVIGTLERDAQGGVELVARGESLLERDIRKGPNGNR